MRLFSTAGCGCRASALISHRNMKKAQNCVHVATGGFVAAFLCWEIFRAFQPGLFPTISNENDPAMSPAAHQITPAGSWRGSGFSTDRIRLFPDKSGSESHVGRFSESKPQIVNGVDRLKQLMSQNSYRKSSLFLVSSSQPNPCQNPNGDYLLLKSMKNKMDYCRLHGIGMFYNIAQLDPAMASFWVKLPLVRSSMVAHPEAEWIWWVDSDAFFTDMAFELPLQKYANYNLVVHGWEKEVFEKKSWIGLNMGVFLIRNCQWSLDLLDEWAALGVTGPLKKEIGKFLTSYLSDRPMDFEADDQGALIYLLNAQPKRWRSKVYLESSYALHGYWVKLVDKYEEMRSKYHPGYGDDRWPLITHFVGCELCSGEANASYSAENCRQNVERAFNFADDQILETYGLHHQSLQSSNVFHI